MRQGLLVAALSCAVVSMVFAFWVHTRLKATPAERWSARGSVVLGIGMIIGMVPAMIFPSSNGIRIAASLVSIVFTVGSVVATRHVYRRLHQNHPTAAQDARR